MLMDIIKARHSTRKYTTEQISREDMETILEAGNFAPNAGGGQHSMMVGVRKAELARKIGMMNLARFNRANLADGFVDKELIAFNYPQRDFHEMYIGEVVKILSREMPRGNESK